jgi:hypothetical protein
MAPKDVNKNKEADLWTYMYMKAKNKIRKYLFKTCDLVRISCINMLFDRSYDEYFTIDILMIKSDFACRPSPCID